MISKIFILAVALATVSTQKHRHVHAQHGHSHAVSSRSFLLHQVHHRHSKRPDQHETVQHHAPAHEQVSVHHLSPAHHAVPIYHAAPLYQAASVHNAAPAQHGKHHHEEEHHEYYYTHPKYVFAYAVEDPHTGVGKSQHEARDGDIVKGYYSLNDADSSVRSIKHGSNKHPGFNTYVKHSKPVKHIQPQRLPHYV